MGWHIVITEEMRALGLSGNDLMVFALIYGFSQNGQGSFYGSLAYICETCGISRRTAIYILQELVEKGLITKTESMLNGVKYVAYQVSAISALSVQKLHLGGAKTAPNNIDDNINNKRESKGFVPPTIEDVRLFCQERGNGIDPEEFVAFYTSKGWMVGKSKMKDWKSAVITWEKARKKETRTPRPRTARKESTFEHNMREMDKLFGTNYHEQMYGKEVADEQ